MSRAAASMLAANARPEPAANKATDNSAERAFMGKLLEWFMGKKAGA
jgi:hypothetical protein